MTSAPADSPLATPEVALEFLLELADDADPLAMRRFRATDLQIETKPDTSLVTEADLAIEELVREKVRAHHPELVVCGEEHGQEPDSGAGRLWVDPIDATANFARGIPIFATLLAIEVEERVIAGVVSAPGLKTRWWAARGLGAQRNGKPIRVSRVSELSLAQAFHGSLGGFEAPELPPGHRTLLEATRRQRGFGDFYQHVLVAEGAGDLALDPVVKPWDIAPLTLIAHEAGGRATTLTGSEDLHAGNLVTTNGRLHAQVLATLAGEPLGD